MAIMETTITTTTTTIAFLVMMRVMMQVMSPAHLQNNSAIATMMTTTVVVMVITTAMIITTTITITNQTATATKGINNTTTITIESALVSPTVIPIETVIAIAIVTPVELGRDKDPNRPNSTCANITSFSFHLPTPHRGKLYSAQLVSYRCPEMDVEMVDYMYGTFQRYVTDSMNLPDEDDEDVDEDESEPLSSSHCFGDILGMSGMGMV